MAQANPTTKPAASQRDIKAVSKAFAAALEAVAEDQRPAVSKAVVQKIQADEKTRREKLAAAKAKAKLKAAAKSYPGTKASEHAREVPRKKTAKAMTPAQANPIGSAGNGSMAADPSLTRPAA